MIFAVFDPSPLTVCINCSFLNLSLYQSVRLTRVKTLSDLPSRGRSNNMLKLSIFYKYACIANDKLCAVLVTIDLQLVSASCCMVIDKLPSTDGDGLIQLHQHASVDFSDHSQHSSNELIIKPHG